MLHHRCKTITKQINPYKQLCHHILDNIYNINNSHQYINELDMGIIIVISNELIISSGVQKRVSLSIGRHLAAHAHAMHASSLAESRSEPRVDPHKQGGAPGR